MICCGVARGSVAARIGIHRPPRVCQVLPGATCPPSQDARSRLRARLLVSGAFHNELVEIEQCVRVRMYLRAVTDLIASDSQFRNRCADRVLDRRWVSHGQSSAGPVSGDSAKRQPYMLMTEGIDD